MKRWKTVIVDDEPLARLNLKRLLNPFEEVQIVAEADSCDTATKAIDDHQAELVFLDIQLIGESGFDLLERLTLEPSTHIIFVTAFDEYAVRAFEVNALDYLLKPVNPDRLRQTMQRIRDGKGSENKKTAKGDLTYNDTLFFKTDHKTSRFVSVASILAITPVGNHSEILTVDGDKIVILKNLKQWESELPVSHFIRIHKSCIVNREKIEKIEKISTGENMLHLKNSSQTFPVSRRQLQQLRTLTNG